MTIRREDLPTVPEPKQASDVGRDMVLATIALVTADKDLSERFDPITDRESANEAVEVANGFAKDVQDHMGNTPAEAFAKAFGVDEELVTWAIDLMDAVQAFTQVVNKHVAQAVDRATRKASGMPERPSIDLSFLPPGIREMAESMLNAAEGCPCDVCAERRANGEVPDHSEDDQIDMPSEDDIAKWLNELPETDEPTR